VPTVMRRPGIPRRFERMLYTGLGKLWSHDDGDTGAGVAMTRRKRPGGDEVPGRSYYRVELGHYGSV
jgi:hypothetical protein